MTRVAETPLGGDAPDAHRRSLGTLTQIMSMVLGIGVAALLLVGSSWLEALPIPVVAGVVAFAGARLTRLGHLRTLVVADPRHGRLAVVTLLATLVRVELGVVTLVVLSPHAGG